MTTYKIKSSIISSLVSAGATGLTEVVFITSDGNPPSLSTGGVPVNFNVGDCYFTIGGVQYFFSQCENWPPNRTATSVANGNNWVIQGSDDVSGMVFGGAGFTLALNNAFVDFMMNEPAATPSGSLTVANPDSLALFNAATISNGTYFFGDEVVDPVGAGFTPEVCASIYGPDWATPGTQASAQYFREALIFSTFRCNVASLVSSGDVVTDLTNFVAAQTQWNFEEIYSQGDIVQDGGSAYRSLINGNQSGFGDPGAWEFIEAWVLDTGTYPSVTMANFTVGEIMQAATELPATGAGAPTVHGDKAIAVIQVDPTDNGVVWDDDNNPATPPVALPVGSLVRNITSGQKFVKTPGDSKAFDPIAIVPDITWAWEADAAAAWASLQGL